MVGPERNGEECHCQQDGQQTDLIIEADNPGEYWGQCGDFCGLSHALMRARVRAVDQADYEGESTNRVIRPTPLGGLGEQIVLQRSWEAPKRPIEQYASVLGRLV
mgnify:CR=1 FL=1